ncbi:3-deoxy-D-manno-octulosonic acid transferase [Schlesneria paludicola]|uniref:3-deoxy-D-manno-octulosonic acid transferase n=1 Tax=Schlesneria paludicola TaxID=360056 RepID=UPI00029B4ECE|nr:glycosyltransferase N-terminal domain-containing protein [Schlesneria paludicola]
MRFLLDLIYLAAYLLFCLLSLFWSKSYADAVHAFGRNFWGRYCPELDGRPVVWMHAVSVGESLICGPLLKRLRAQRPDLQFVMSVGTSDGFLVASREYSDLFVFKAPADFSWAVARTFEQLRPVALVISENDFWPNMLGETRRREVPLAIFNTRITQREIAEHDWNAWMFRSSLQRTRWWGVVSEGDADWIRRFFRVGSPPLEVTGSLKLDGHLRDSMNPRTEQYRKLFGFGLEDRVLVAGSTHDDEELCLAAIVREIAVDFPRIRLVLVPRLVSRCPEIAAELRKRGFEFVVESQLLARCEVPSLVTLVDSTGNLRDLWGLGEFAFVGGSLAPKGGHNMVEPASYGLAVTFGPSVTDFQRVADELVAAGGAVQVCSRAALSDLIRFWMNCPEEASAVGNRARKFVKSQCDSLETTVRGVLSVFPPPMDSLRPPSSERVEDVGESDATGNVPTNQISEAT